MALNKRNALTELVKELEKNYLLQRACNKSGLTRSTVYRWMRADESFANKIRVAQTIGRRYMSDFVESKLLKNIENGDQRAIEFWLKNNNEHYHSTEKATQRKIDQLTEDLQQSRAALNVMGRGNVYKDFIDWPKVMEYAESPEFKTATELEHGIYAGSLPNEKVVLDQARRIVTEFKIAEFIADAGILPEEPIDLVD